MPTLFDFGFANVRVCLRLQPQSAGKAKRRRRSTRLEVLQVEERLLLSATVALARAHGRVAADALTPTLTPIERLGYYNPQTQSYEQLVDVRNYQSLLQGKDVYVLVHGWAPGYISWVKNYEDKFHQVLEWWQTIPSNYHGAAEKRQYQAIKKLDTSGAGPESPWLLDGYPDPVTQNSTIVSAGGLTQDLLKTDPNAVVLAYSWLDDSATSIKTENISPFKDLPIDIPIPQDAYHSEAETTVNGARLAVALEQVLGTESQFGGKLQLIGHSHGSKVATVAADLLTTAPSADRLTVNQLTTLDSPESDSYGGPELAEAGATNDNWYFMQDLNISQNPSQSTASSTFIDNYISAVDEPYDKIEYTKQGVSYNLSQVVDTVLYAWPLYRIPANGQTSTATPRTGTPDPRSRCHNRTGNPHR